MRIAKAQLKNLHQINELIQHSKSFWDYEKDYLEKALEVICLDEQYFNDNECYEVLTDNLVGFISIIKGKKYLTLDNLWIDPEYIKKGYGSKCLEFIFQNYQGQKVIVYPEPPSQDFYLKYGFKPTGKSKPSRVKGGPLFKEFEYHA